MLLSLYTLYTLHPSHLITHACTHPPTPQPVKWNDDKIIIARRYNYKFGCHRKNVKRPAAREFHEQQWVKLVVPAKIADLFGKVYDCYDFCEWNGSHQEIDKFIVWSFRPLEISRLAQFTGGGIVGVSTERKRCSSSVYVKLFSQIGRILFSPTHQVILN